ncbi:RNA polymerase II mediator complex subunit Sin4 [Xylariaceae sp. FL0016]|nr:RNA polymerase II mediator complex subunit Sin4 [Xylariaceae sp. FL0016]
MPLILDGHAMGGMEDAPMPVDLGDVDDLFGDGAPLSLPPRSLTRRLRQRLDELRGRGCCQGISWSKQGTIASIAADGQNLHLRYLRADPKDASWALSEHRAYAPSANFIGGPIVHLTWSPANSDLAVIDIVGRVTILNFNNELNRPMLHRSWDGDPVDDLHSVVGTYWLNPLPAGSRYNPIYGPAVKPDKGTEYKFDTSGMPSLGPSHPHPNKSALLCVTTNGLVKMFWAQNTGKVEESTLELDSVTSADDLVTHAAICSDKTNCIFIAMATRSKQLRVVQVGINFNPAKPENPQAVPPGGHSLSPQLAKRHVAVTSWYDAGEHLDSAMTKISHIEIIPAQLQIQSKSWTPVQVLTVRSFVPEPNLPYGHDVQSVIDRWELHQQQPQNLHPAFEQLGSRRNSVGTVPPTAARLKKLGSTVVNKVVMGVNILSLGKVICFTYHDGTVEYRDRYTMDELYREPKLDQISSIFEAGFTHSGEASCLQTAFSPSHFSLVQMYEDGQVRWHNLEYTLGDPSSISDENLAAVVAGFVISTASAVTSATGIDDILAAGRRFVHKDHFTVKWVTNFIQLMRVSIDYADDAPHDQLIRNHTLQLCFSIFNHLGWNGEFNPRHPRSKISMLALSLRQIIILVSMASNAPKTGTATSSPLDEPEVVSCLADCIKWSIDLICWLCDSLFCLLDDRKFMGFLSQSNQSQQLVNMTQYLHSKNNIALHLILSSSTRNFVSAICRRINLMDNCASRALNWYTNRGEITDSTAARHQALHAAYRKVKRYTSAALVKADNFDAFLVNISSDIRNAYSTSLPGLAERETQRQKNQNHASQNSNSPKPPDRVKEARQHCELSLLLGQTPPPSFFNVIAKLFRKDLVEFRSNVDVAKLYFADYELLEIIDEPRALEKRRARGMRVDMFKRTELFKGSDTPWRQCARCGNVVEDLPPVFNKPGMTFLLSQQRMCCCGGRLALLP